MAGEKRLSADPVAQAHQLVAEAPRHGFLPLLKVLERLTPEARRVGGARALSDESIRFRHDPSLSFSAGDVRSLSVRELPAESAGAPPQLKFEVVTTFLGLTGSCTPLPSYIAEEVVREDPKRPIRRDFLDLFHHRLTSLLYRGLLKYDVAAEHTRGAVDRWSSRVLALAGVDTYERPLPPELPAWRLLRLAPLLTCRARTARGLEIALEEVLGEDRGDSRVAVEQFVGGWTALHEDQHSRLGRATARLSESLVVGRKVFDAAGKFRIRIDQLSRETYERLQPGGDLLPVVRETVSLFLRSPMEYDLELLLKPDTVPEFHLSRSAACQLGRKTWLGAWKGQEAGRRVNPKEGARERHARGGGGAIPLSPSAPGESSRDL
jgi:type VI secretion system protein ImpH